LKKGTLQKRLYRSNIRRLKLSLCLVAFVCSAQATFGASLNDIEALLSHADYTKALEEIKLELKLKDLPSKTRTHLYWLKALCHVSEDQIALARSSLINLLATDPFFEPNANASPKILNLFKATLSKVKEQGGFEQSGQTSFIPLEHIVAGEPLPFQIKINDAALLYKAARLELHLRRLGNSEYSALDFKPVDEGGLFEAIIPPILTVHLDRDVTFEYYVDIISENGTRLGGIGRTTLPLNFSAAPKIKNDSVNAQEDEIRSFFSTALWLCAAAVTVGGVIAALLVFSAPQEGTLSLTLSQPE
jgi:hypothetical protein